MAIPHGTRGGYTNHGCRCADCTKANSEAQLEYLYRTGRLGNAPPKPATWHVLSAVDPDRRIAVCSRCGPTAIRSSGRHRGWQCNGKRRGRKYDRRTYRQFLGAACERCGFEPEDECQLDMHHRDGNPTNNAPTNLETLCANCHRLVTRFERKGLPIPSRL